MICFLLEWLQVARYENKFVSQHRLGYKNVQNGKRMRMRVNIWSEKIREKNDLLAEVQDFFRMTVRLSRNIKT